ncbi:MAG: GNAT family N-acetyltransferase [Thermoleophilia bacterium]|nr:GNAT family N-acetyltransferase [Thermoleophilia bacterium]
MSADYPAHREVDVVLRDGSTIGLRPVRPSDEASLREFFDELDPDSQSFRFFSGAANLGRIAHEMARVDYGSRYGLLARRGEEGRPIGHGVYIELEHGQAEVAFAVAEEMQGHGLGTILLAHLAEVAAENGIDTFVAEVLPQNHRMIEMFRESGFPVDVRSDADGIRVELPTSLSTKAIASFEDRDRLAAVEAVRAFLEPRSIAVVGASRRPDSVGGSVLRNLLASGFSGALHAINPAATEVQGLPALAGIEEISGEVDLAIISVPSNKTLAVAHQCAAKGVRALVVLSAGFSESGDEGARRERELLDVCRTAGMRLIGPNCLGVLNTDPEHSLNATFAPGAPSLGDVGFVTQSGALGLALIDLAAATGVGVSSFASVGNRADITANDLLEFWEQDPRTRIALLYIESFSDPRRFSRVARRIGRRKPVVVVKSGRSGSGARAASSHTGALLAASDLATDALFDQSGVIRAETLAELLDVASLLSSQPLPRGPRVGILTNAGGPGIMCADACEAAGLEVPELSEEARAELRAFLPSEAALGNPVDMIATARAEHYRRALAALARWDGIDSVIVIFIRPLLTEAGDVAEAIHSVVEDLPRRLPIQAVFMSPADHALLRETAAVPTHLYPEEAARALGKVVRHVRWRERTPVVPPHLIGLRRVEAAAVLAEGLAEGREWLDPGQSARLLDCYGIAMPDSRAAVDPLSAGQAAKEIGGTVVLKAIGSQILHKTEVGGVRVGLTGAEQVAEAAQDMDDELAHRRLEREAFLVQEQIDDGVELLIGIASDPVFGAVIACGAGGTTAELLGDVQLRVSPLDGADPEGMLNGLAMRPLLEGYRGAAPADIGALRGVIARVGAMSEAHPEILELDLNPVVATSTGAIAVDCRVRIRARPPRHPWPRTWD